MYIQHHVYVHVSIHVYKCISAKSNYGVVHIHITKLILLSLPSSPSIPHSLSFYPYPSLSLPPSLSIFLHLSQVMVEVGATLTPIIMSISSVHHEIIGHNKHGQLGQGNTKDW